MYMIVDLFEFHRAFCNRNLDSKVGGEDGMTALWNYLREIEVRTGEEMLLDVDEFARRYNAARPEVIAAELGVEPARVRDVLAAANRLIAELPNGKLLYIAQ
ncbi:MAG: hypothetical protein QXZ09_08250 [Candidatus Methanomethylicaceae archaeon]